MPVYEYECQKCGAHFDEIQKFSDPPVKKHPGCGGKVKKMLSAPAFQFKGSGWYITDYARKDSASSESKKASDEKKAESKASETKTSESKASDSKASDSKASDNGSAKSDSKPAGKKKT